jgi:ATP phosphoribosyltransferase regulatory subunit HisZ
MEVFPSGFAKSDKISGFRFIYRNGIYVLEPDITLRLMNNRIPDNSRIFYIAQQSDEYLGESLKAGAEIIGGKENEANMEILRTAIKILDNMGIVKYNIDISLSGIFDTYRKEKDGQQLIRAVKNRNYPQIQNMDLDGKDRLLQILNTRSRKSGIDKLDNIISGINDSRVLIDLGTVRQPDYYNGLIFEIYGMREFLGGGGNYRMHNLNGCGFSLDLQAIYKLYHGSGKKVDK